MNVQHLLTRRNDAMWKPVLAVALGSAVGGLVRWFLDLRLNTFFPALPPGTLIANLVAGYVVGVAVGYFAQAPGVAPEWRLLIITGFCGGLSTFSTFSSEVIALLQRGQLPWALGAIGVHVGGSLVMTLAGILTWQWLKSG